MSVCGALGHRRKYYYLYSSTVDILDSSPLHYIVFDLYSVLRTKHLLDRLRKHYPVMTLELDLLRHLFLSSLLTDCQVPIPT